MAVNGEDIVPGIGKKQAAVLNNESARRLEHERHLEELGFPKYVEPGYMRHAPVSYDDPDNPTPSRIVNQAGQDLGDQNKDESDHFAKNTYKPAKKLAKEAFLEFMSKEDQLPNRSQAELQRTEELGLSPDATATEIAQAQGQKDVMYQPDVFDPSVKEASYLAGYDSSTGQAIYGGFTTDAEGNRVAKDPMVVDTANLKPDDPRLGSTFARPGTPDIDGKPMEGSGPGGAITFKDIKPKTEDDAGDGLADMENSIQKSMEIFSNLVKDDGDDKSAIQGFFEDTLKDLTGNTDELRDKVADVIGTDSKDTADKTEEVVEENINEAKKDLDQKLKTKINFPSYAEFRRAKPEAPPTEYATFARDYAAAYDKNYQQLFPEDTKKRVPTVKIDVKPDDPDAVGVPLRFQPGMAGTPAGKGVKQSYQTKVPRESIIIPEEVPPAYEAPGGADGASTTSGLFAPTTLRDVAGSKAQSYSLNVPTPDKIDLPNVSPEKKEALVSSALQSVGISPTNVFQFVEKPDVGDTKAAMQISPDQRMDPNQRAALAEFAFKRELARLVDTPPSVTKMEKYQAWIQKAEDEGAMAKVQLDRVSDLADMMHDALDEEDQLPGWIQNKISDSLHNLEASFTHIAYDKKQDMELSKSKETFTNILQKDNHTPQAQIASQIGNPMPQNFAAVVGAVNEVNKDRAGLKNFFSGKPSINPIKTVKGLTNKVLQGMDVLYGKGSLNFKKPLEMAKPLTVGTQGSVLRGAIKGTGGLAAYGVTQQLLPIYSEILFPELSDSSKETLIGLSNFEPQTGNAMAKLTGEIAQQVVPSPERLNQRKGAFTSAINSLKNVGQGIFKEDISLQKDEGGFDAFGRPTTPAITPKPRRGTGVRRGTAAELGETSEPPRRGPLSSLDDPTIDLSPQEKEILRGTKRDLFGFPKRSLGEVTLEPSGDLSAAEQRAKIERISQQIPESSIYQGRDPRGRATLARGASKGLRDAIYDELLDNPPKEVGRGMGTPLRAFGGKYKTPLELDRGAGRFTAMPPTKQELLQVQDYVDDFKSGAIKAGKGILRGKKGLISLLGAAGLGSAFNYLQQQGADLFDDGGSTRVQ